ncbi:aspartate--tRNA ligase [uncultured Helcococcus sp.]|uniref:aspartate--tRNA ligase n=1 Tax=uncultured Helcococcus sp. TaxID=1072508 RepID=UPI002630E3D3|nr:aspartate--tRNA ligase [uncultured Helcococcus sp.]
MKRTNYCGQLNLDNLNEEVILKGWVQKTRDLGPLLFVDLRDKTGITQLVFKKDDNEDLYLRSKELKSEYVIGITGKVSERESKNPDIPTGDIEVIVSELKVYDKAQTPPIYIKDGDNASEDLRLKYRYLDLRKHSMQETLKMRAEIVKAFRDFLYENDFVEVETPFLMKPTPEGARDYVVPSRVHPGSFYALPQSPQLYKQLLMIGGLDRYYQVAKCFRDEDLRANRQPEFTQVDLEMSFVDEEDVIEINERLIQYIFKQVKNIDLPVPFPRLTYKEAMERFGSDKPDLRYGFEIQDISDLEAAIEFNLFNDAVAEGKKIKAINFNGLSSEYSRKQIDKLTKEVKGIGASGLLWFRYEEGEIKSSINKFLNADFNEKLIERLKLEENDLALVIIDKEDKALDYMGSLRVMVANNHVEFKDDDYAITWINEFPMFEYNEEEDRYVAKHHPFTHPVDEDIELLESEPEKVRAKAYDIVINGDEMGGGSIRINNSDLQQRLFKALKLSEEDIERKFGFFVEALKYGTPPHGGLAFGLDRFVMTLLNKANIKDVIAFPKTQSATDLMSQAPTKVEDAQLEELGLEFRD